MVNKEFIGTHTEQILRKSSVPVEIPKRSILDRQMDVIHTSRQMTSDNKFSSSFNKKSSTTKGIPMNRIGYGVRNNSRLDSSGDEEMDDDDDGEYIMFRAPVVADTTDTSPSAENTKQLKNMRNRKCTVVCKPTSAYLENVKKKKSSSGVSSSSDDNNFQQHALNNEISRMVTMDRRRSDNSIEEISSSECTPASSRRSSEKNISQQLVKSVGKKSSHGFFRDSRKPRHSSEYQTNLANKLSDAKVSASSKIGHFEKLYNEQKVNSNKSIYETRGRRKHTAASPVEKIESGRKEKSKRAISLQEVKTIDKPDSRKHKSISERVSSIFSKRKSHQENGSVIKEQKKKTSAAVIKEQTSLQVVEISKVQSEYELRKRSKSISTRRISSNNSIDKSSDKARRMSSTNCNDKGKTRRASSANCNDSDLSFGEIQGIFSTNKPQPRRRVTVTVSTADQSTQTENASEQVAPPSGLNHRLLFHHTVNNLIADHVEEKQRRRTLPPQFIFSKKHSSGENGVSVVSRKNSKNDHNRTEEQQATTSTRSTSCQPHMYQQNNRWKNSLAYENSHLSERYSYPEESGSDNTTFLNQMNRENKDSSPSSTTIGAQLEEDLEKPFYPLPWQNQCLSPPSPKEEAKRRFSLNPRPVARQEPVRKNKSLEVAVTEPMPQRSRKTSSRKTSLSAIQNVPWGDKRLSVDVPVFSQTENTIDEKNEEITEMDNETDELSEKVNEECGDSPSASLDGFVSDNSDHDEDSDSSLSTPPTRRRNTIRDALCNAPWYDNEYKYDEVEEEGPATPGVRTMALNMSMSFEKDDMETPTSFEDQPKISVIQRPSFARKIPKVDDRLLNETSEKKLFQTLADLQSERSLEMHGKTESSSSLTSDYIWESRSRSGSQNQSEVYNAVQPRQRKFGITHLQALDTFPKRRRSIMPQDFNEWQASIEENSPKFTQKISTAFGPHSHPFVQFDHGGIEIVSDQGTLDVIADSYDALNIMDSGTTPRSFEDSATNAIAYSSVNKDHMFLSRWSLDNVDEEQEMMTPTGESSPPSFESASWFLERKKKEMLGHVNSPVQERKFFEEEEEEEDMAPHSVSFNDVDSTANKNSTAYSTMFGYFNYYLFVFITKESGNEKWKEIVKLAGLKKEQRKMFEKPKHITFDDNLTERVLQAAASVLRTNLKLLINKYGIKYYDYCVEKWGDILKSIATDLTDFINNMDDIQRHIHKIEKIPNDSPSSIHASIDKKGTLLMFYRSSHEMNYFEFFLMGFIKRVAWDLFGKRSRISISEERTGPNNYSTITIKSIASLIKKPSLSTLQMSTKCKDLIIEPDLMDKIFPFHIILNEKLEITQLGDSLNRLLEHFIPKHGYDIRTYFKLDAPNVTFSYESIQRNLNTSFIISMFTRFTGVNGSNLILKGQIGQLQTSKCIWFIGSPKVDYVKNLNSESDLFLSDIPLHDVTREVLLVGEQKHSVETLKDQLQTMTNRLKETSKELAIGKINTENILDQMFPKDVADKLMRDLPVPAVTTETVTILFTDIVGFTAICERCDPEEVTVMLNKLYLAFDYLCEAFEIYKVETIGDAYMAVGGLHHSTFDHGRRVTAMGVEMVRHAENVNIPRSKDNLQIRVGIHSGSVVAGVVGTLMPRYCLFGNNVTLANKMESTSQSGKVHLSPYTYLQIKHYQEFIFWERPRNVMPNLVDLSDPKIKYVNSFFVDRHKDQNMIPTESSSQQKAKPYMMQSRHFDARSRISQVRSSRRNSQTESTLSEHYNMFYPEDLRIQIEALDKLNGKGSLLLNS